MTLDISLHWALIPAALLLLFTIFRLLNYKGGNVGNVQKEKESKNFSFKPLFSSRPSLPFNEKSVEWCANFLSVDEKELQNILYDIASHYKSFKLRKRSGGYRTISAPDLKLLQIQRTIYQRVLVPVTIHPSATGFKPKTSIVQNTKPHLGNAHVLKVDIEDFFGSIKKSTVNAMFQMIGYPQDISEILTHLCCLYGKLPQGAPTSPALSNIAAYKMDTDLSTLAFKYQLTYTRYADDLTFSGKFIPFDDVLEEIVMIIYKYGFSLNAKKTLRMHEKSRKIITGISVSSGYKLTIPKAKKRELRKNIHYITQKGVMAHQKHIASTDPAYLKRIIGYLNFWLLVEPDNNYVKKSIATLNRMNIR